MSQRFDQHARLVLPGGYSATGLVAEHWNGVYSLMYRLTSNTHDAEDLTQQTFLQALEKISQFQAGTNMRSWLLRIGTNCFLDFKRRRRPVSVEPSGLDIATSAEVPAGPLEQSEVAAELQQALLQIPETQRVVFLLRTTEDLSFRQIAEMIGATEVTARWHMLQARNRLLELLKGKL